MFFSACRCGFYDTGASFSLFGGLLSPRRWWRTRRKWKAPGRKTQTKPQRKRAEKQVSCACFLGGGFLDEFCFFCDCIFVLGVFEVCLLETAWDGDFLCVALSHRAFSELSVICSRFLKEILESRWFWMGHDRRKPCHVAAFVASEICSAACCSHSIIANPTNLMLRHCFSTRWEATVFRILWEHVLFYQTGPRFPRLSQKGTSQGSSA